MNEKKRIAGNYYNKYASKRFLEKQVVTKFLQTIQDLIFKIDYLNVLDAGCGEGYIANLIRSTKKCNICGMDIGQEVLQKAARDFPHIYFTGGSAYNLPFKDNSFDLVVACEILEHLDYPERALEELRRVTKRWVLISVPREPLWSILNMTRGKYLNEFGNTPGHVQHWDTKGISKLASNYLRVLQIRKPVPWTVMLCENDTR